MSDANNPLSKINCPRCGTMNTWRPDNPSRPFCSERCKLIDLGAWAEEKHRLPENADDIKSHDPSSDNTDEE